MEEENISRKIRIEKGYSVSDLAKAIGKDQSSLSRYEAGQIPLDVATKLYDIKCLTCLFNGSEYHSITFQYTFNPCNRFSLLKAN